MPQKRKILLLDTGKEWGGGTNSMLELLKRINRDKFDITCCFYSDYSRAEGQTIGQVLNSMGSHYSLSLNVSNRHGQNS